MNDSTKNQVKGTLHVMKGTVKEVVGNAMDKPELEAEGKDEKLVGQVQTKIGQIEKVFEK